MTKPLVLRGGRVLDPSQGRDEVADVIMSEGTVVGSGRNQGTPDGAGAVDDRRALWRRVEPRAGVLDPAVADEQVAPLVDALRRVDDAAAAEKKGSILVHHGCSGLWALGSRRMRSRPRAESS